MRRYFVRTATTTLGVSALLASGLVAGTATAATADTADTTARPASGTTAAACSAKLPGYVQGKPSGLHPYAAGGLYVWHDAAGWHVRATHANRSTVVYSGVVHASSPITFAKVADERHDSVVLSKGGRTLAFRLVNHGRIDGFDFRDACATTTGIDLRVNGRHASPSAFHIGAHGVHARTNPWVVRRTA